MFLCVPAWSLVCARNRLSPDWRLDASRRLEFAIVDSAIQNNGGAVIFDTRIALPSNFSLTTYGPGRVRIVKLISTGGTTHPCNDGQPGSLVELRQSDAVALLISDGSTAPFGGSA